jgi:hypothetical protein
MTTPYNPLGIVPGLGAPTTPQPGAQGAGQGTSDFKTVMGGVAPATGTAPVGKLVASETPRTLGAGYDALTPEQTARYRSTFDNMFPV